jgi:hypothetical protein
MQKVDGFRFASAIDQFLCAVGMSVRPVIASGSASGPLATCHDAPPALEAQFEFSLAYLRALGMRRGAPFCEHLARCIGPLIRPTPSSIHSQQR